MSNYTEKNGFINMKINDGHWHICRHRPVDESLNYIKKAKEYLGLDKIAFLSYEYADDTGLDNSSNLKALYLRDNIAGDAYAFAALSHYGDERDTAPGFLEQVKLYHALGFDGIKILEGKPDYHDMFNCKFDGGKYDAMFAYLAENKIPVIAHVADFVAFPNPEREKKREELQKEFLNVLEKYPDLKITFAHMFNMAHDRLRLTEIMETYKNVSVDLALGGDFLMRFSADHDGWNEFFIKFSDRVIYGTDTYNDYFTEEDDFNIATRHTPVRKFFESKEPFSAVYYDLNPGIYGENVVINPALLPENIVYDIYINSFKKAFGDKPRKTDISLVQKHCNDVLEGYNSGRLKSCLYKPLPEWLSEDVKKNAERSHELALENLETIRNYYLNEVKK